MTISVKVWDRGQACPGTFARNESNAMTTHDYPVLTGDTVTERHARICRERGHATWTRDGQDVGQCPRCGDVPTRVLPSGDTVRAYRAGEWS